MTGRIQWYWLASGLLVSWLGVAATVLAQAPAEPPNQNPPVNPQQLLRNLFQLFRPQPQPMFPGNDSPNETGDGSKDPVDARVPKDPQINSLWRAGDAAIKQQEWKRAVELLQKLLDLPEDAAIEAQPGQWESVRTAANRQLGALPQTVLQDYERQYGGLAKQLFDEARARPDIPKLVDVATRFFHTPAGADAAAQLALWHFDQQEFISATRWNQELLIRGWRGANDPRWQLQAAFAARQARVNDLQPFLKDVLETPQPVSLGGRNVLPRDWWAQTSLSTPPVPTSQDWREFGGSTARLAAGTPGAPLLLPEWTQPLTAVPAVRERLEQLLQDLSDDDCPTILAASPVVLGDKLAFRDLRSVRVVDVSTGRTLWQTEEGISPERILNGVAAQNVGRQQMWRVRVNVQSFDQEYQGDSAEMHPLASWLFRDATNGFLSTDGLRLYVLEDVAVMTRNQSGYNGDPNADATDPYGATWNSNRLSAYDLNTGHLEWTIGGPPTVETVQPPLAGTFFFGVPTADRDELYVVAATGQEIRLQALDPATGRQRWSQLLAYSDTKIELDIARRWFSAPVAIRDGLIVCPTTVGWLTAVDRTRRCLLWAHRYWPRQGEHEFDPASQFLPQRSLTESWSVGAPIICGSQVLFAPPDADTLVCLNLLDGQVRWERARDDGLYVSAISPSQVLLVSQVQAEAIDVATGETAWEVDWDDSLTPSGRGCLYGDVYALPVSSGGVWLIDLQTGKVREELHVPAGQSPLGNLVKAGHRFVSLSAESCRVFSEKDRFLEQLAEQRQTAPSDWQTLLRSVDYELLQRQPQAALKLLDDGRIAEASPEQLERAHAARWTALMSLVANDPAQSTGSLDRLSQIAQTPAERFQIESARVDHLLAKGESRAALERLWSMTKTPSALETVIRPDDDDVSVDHGAWLTGRLLDLWQQADDELRAEIDARVQETLDRALAGPIDDWIPLTKWIDFHPAASRVHWAIAEQWGLASMFPRAEAELLPWAEHADRGIAWETQLRLARLWTRVGLTKDAVAQVQRVLAVSTDRETVLPSGLTVAGAIHEWQLPTEFVEPVSAYGAAVGHRPLSTVRMPAAHVPQVLELVPPEGTPLFDGLQMQLESQEQRLTFQSRETGDWTWLAPLRSASRVNYQNHASYEFLGHRVVVLHRNVLQMFSPVREELVWSTSVGEEHTNDFDVHRQPPMQMLDPSNMDGDGIFWGLRQSYEGRLPICNQTAIGVMGRRSLDVYDPQTGRVRWSHRNLPAYAMILATSDVVFVVDNSTNTTVPYRLLDGKPLELLDLQKDLNRTFAIVGSDLIQVEQARGLRLFNLASGKITVRRRNPLTAADKWTSEFASGTQFGRAGARELLCVGPVGRSKKEGRAVELLDLETGKRRACDNLPVNPEEEGLTPIVDRERIYLIVNHGHFGNYNYGDSLPSTRVHGTIYVWDRATGRLLWQRKIDDQNLVLDRFDSSPVLLFLARNWKQVGQATYTTLHLLALNKETGEPLHDSTTPSLFSGFHGIRIAEPEHEVELLSYNLRVRLTPEPVK